MEWVDAYVDYWNAMGCPGYEWSDPLPADPSYRPMRQRDDGTWTF
jgi:hypothetical protein